MNNAIADHQALMEVLPIHFDIDAGFLTFEEFTAVAASTKQILENFNKEFFDGALQYQFVVLPPKKGTFLETLGIIMSPITAAGIFIHTEVGKAFIRGLTDHEPVHWGEVAGKKTRQALMKVPAKIQEAKNAAVILAECTKGFLQKDTASLRQIGVTESKFRDAYAGRNQVFEVCERNPEIKGIGFDTTEVFPIRRKDYSAYIVDLPPVEVDAASDWTVEEHNIKVASPNWARSGRQWQAKTSEGKTIAFTVEDEGFWYLVEKQDLKPRIFDNLKVQLAYTNDNGRKKNIRVLQVLEFNGRVISKKLAGHALKEALGHYIEPTDQAKDLFDF